jgi:hypothetical protein
MWSASVVRAVGDGECFLLPGRGRWLGGEDRLLTGYQTTLPWIATTGGSRLFSIYIYMCSYHWILLDIQIDKGRVDAFDPLSRPLE